MSFSKEWDHLYKENSHLSIWPWSDLVSYVMRYSRPKSPKEYNVLELGCGAGANIEFFNWLGVNYYALEGSPTMVKMLKKKFPNLKTKIKAADFTDEIPFDIDFDLIVDRAALTHNDSDSIRKCISNLCYKMRIGASYIGIDWFSINHSDYKNGKSDLDDYTKSNYPNGQFKGVGKVHFSTKKHIEDLFAEFEIKILEEKIIYRSIPPDSHVFASWNFHAIKKTI